MILENAVQVIDANELNAQAIFDVRHCVTGSFQIELGDASSWGSTVLTLYRSNDRLNWAAMASATTATAVGFTSEIDTAAIAWLKWEVTTVAGAAAFLTIAPCFKGDA